ncbi:hypothetical protein PS619_02563 [Pseudomonas fluorescens]|nr:hypothetical protein PS619_02563 [Pseudomonas fluorescens]
MFSPFNMEDLAAGAVEAFKLLGDARAIAVLVSGECTAELINTDFGVNYWQLMVALPIPLYYAMTDVEREATGKAIYDVVTPFYSPLHDEALNGVTIAPRIGEASENWREEAIRYVKGEGVTNQGRVRSDNIASREHQGLLFRSQAEVALFTAMTRAQLAVAPLPVFVRIGKAYNRLEPDFVVVFKGLTFIIEVDGDTYHRESPADADKRLVPLTWEGVEVRRIRASELSSDNAANVVVKDLIDFMTKRKAAR